MPIEALGIFTISGNTAYHGPATNTVEWARADGDASNSDVARRVYSPIDDKIYEFLTPDTVTTT